MQILIQRVSIAYNYIYVQLRVHLSLLHIVVSENLKSFI